MKRNGTIIGVYDTHYIVRIPSGETFIAHKSVNKTPLSLLDEVEFVMTNHGKTITAKDCRILLRGNNPRLNRLIETLLNVPELEEYKIEQVATTIITGAKLTLDVVGVRTFAGGLRIVSKK